MKAIEGFFHVVLFTMLYKAGLTGLTFNAWINPSAVVTILIQMTVTSNVISICTDLCVGNLKGILGRVSHFNSPMNKHGRHS